MSRRQRVSVSLSFLKRNFHFHLGRSGSHTVSLQGSLERQSFFFFFLFHRLYNREGQGERVRALLVAETVKNPPAIQETLVQFLGQEDLLEKRMFTHSSILAWRIPWTEEPGRLLFMGSQRIGNDSASIPFTSLSRRKRNVCGQSMDSFMGPILSTLSRAWVTQGCIS